MPASSYETDLLESFLEGLVAPFLELGISIVLYALYSTLDALISALGALQEQPPPDSYSFTWLSVRVVPLVLGLTGFIDLIRNFALAFLKPANTFALAVGELFSLLLMVRTLVGAQPFLHLLASSVLSLTLMLLGILARVVVSAHAEVLDL